METTYRIVEKPPKKRGCFIRYSILAVAIVLILVALVTVAVLAAFFGPGRKSSVSEENSQDNQKEINQTSRLSCDVAIVGGGIGGLYVAETLLRLQKETNVCLFERDDRFGGRVRDYSFQRAPDIPISLGAWRLDKSFSVAWEIIKRFNISYDLMAPSHNDRLEARGIFVTDREALKREAFPALNKGQFQNSTYREMTGYVFSQIDKVGNFSTLSSFLSEFLTPEGWQYFGDVNHFKPDYSREPNADGIADRAASELEYIYSKPVKGVSVLTDVLESSAIQLGAKFYKGEEVRNIEDEENQFKLVTKNFAVTAKTLVVAVPVKPLKKITGSVAEKIQNDLTFQSVNYQVAFKGFAVYEEAWWQRNSTGSRFLADEQLMVSNSDCLGYLFPYKQRGPRGEAILQTSYAKFSCGVKWGEMLKISKTTTDEEMHRALKRLFPGVNIPKPLESVYVYWEEGFMHLQRAGTHIPLKAVADWAKRPIQGKDVFVVGEAYHPLRGWTEGALLSAQNALREGWSIKFEDSGRKRAVKRKRNAETYSDFDLFPWP